MSGNPFFPLDELGFDNEENQMMVIPKVDKEIYDQRRKMAGTMVDYKEMRMRYSCAIKEVRTKFDVLNSEFNVRYQRNPITSINSRLKSSTSIMEKLNRKGLSFTVENVEENLYDVAGIRVVCSYVDDIYVLAEALAQQDDITVIRRKDYIRSPKPNGYRSYHMIVSVPVFSRIRRGRWRWRYRSVRLPWISGQVWSTSSSISRKCPIRRRSCGA